MMPARAAGGHAMGAARPLRSGMLATPLVRPQLSPTSSPTSSGHTTYALKAARAAAPPARSGAAGREECRWQRDQLPEAIRALVLDDQRLRNSLCWSVFDCGDRLLTWPVARALMVDSMVGEQALSRARPWSAGVLARLRAVCLGAHHALRWDSGGAVLDGPVVVHGPLAPAAYVRGDSSS